MPCLYGESAGRSWKRVSKGLLTKRENRTVVTRRIRAHLHLRQPRSTGERDGPVGRRVVVCGTDRRSERDGVDAGRRPGAGRRAERRSRPASRLPPPIPRVGSAPTTSRSRLSSGGRSPRTSRAVSRRLSAGRGSGLIEDGVRRFVVQRFPHDDFHTMCP